MTSSFLALVTEGQVVVLMNTGKMRENLRVGLMR